MSKKEFFSRQTPEIQELMETISTTHTSTEIVEVLNARGVAATKNHVYHYRRANNIKIKRYESVVPAESHRERVGQYISAVRELGWNMWKNINLGCPCAAYARCATKLCDAGLIEKVEGYRPVKYTRLVSDDVMDAWYSQEMMK